MRKLFLFISSVILLSGCSLQKENLERWATFDGKNVYLPKVGENQARVFFYREDDYSAPPIKIFIDGYYLTSILKNSYKPANICSTGELLSLGFIDALKFVKRDMGIDYNFVVGKTHYVKIILNNEMQPVFQRVDEEEGKKAVARLKEVTHTLSRVNSNKVCDKSVLEKIILDSNLLFKFNKANYNGLLSQGRQKIEKIGEQISLENTKITDIKIVGYADPMGNDVYNQKLSERRAKTVKDALALSTENINIEYQGLGEKNLVVKNCSTRFGKNRAKQIACNQPNRRVEIIFYGNSKK